MKDNNIVITKNKLPWDIRVPWRFQRIFRLLCFIGKHIARIGSVDGKILHCAHCGKDLSK